MSGTWRNRSRQQGALAGSDVPEKKKASMHRKRGCRLLREHASKSVQCPTDGSKVAGMAKMGEERLCGAQAEGTHRGVRVMSARTCETFMRRSRRASRPASVHMALMSAPESSSCAKRADFAGETGC
eukprot:6186439-Pleurochrysis_carterae.AAC.1